MGRGRCASACGNTWLPLARDPKALRLALEWIVGGVERLASQLAARCRHPQDRRMSDQGTTDWAAWSREAVQLMQKRNAEWQARFALERCPFSWDLNTACIRFQRGTDDVLASICLVGTTSASDGTFLWAWANEAIPAAAQKGLDLVRAFGAKHDLGLLTTGEFPGGRPEALEMLAVAGRVLEAEGVFIDAGPDVTCFFALSGFRVASKG
jgi:hypothetical protein